MKLKYETERLILEVCNGTKAGLVCDFYNRNFEELALYEPLSDNARTISYHKRNLDYELSLFSEGSFVRFYIFEKKNPMTVIGTVSYRDITRNFYDCCTIGYKIDKDKRRLGYCREAIKMGDSLMFDELGLNRIEATVRPQNRPSIKLLESLGYVNEGLLREKVRINGVYADHYLFSLLRKDYRP